MTATSPRALLMSVGLHLLVAAIMLLVAYTTSRQADKVPRILELVAGEGDNFMATAAPALGTPNAPKLDAKIPALPPAPVEPPAPAPIEAAPPPPPVASPVAPAPTKAPEKAPEKKVNLAKDLRREIIRAESKAKMQAARERAEEQKRLAEEAKKKRLTKEEFDKQNKGKATPTPKGAARKVVRIDTEGIKKGVLGGSTANKEGGAGGNALTAEEGGAAERYLALLLTRLKEQLDLIPGLEEGLRAEAEFRILPDGRLTRSRIMKPSGDEEFDRAVLQAIANVKMPDRPKGVDEYLTVPFTTHARQ